MLLMVGFVGVSGSAAHANVHNNVSAQFLTVIPQFEVSRHYASYQEAPRRPIPRDSALAGLLPVVKFSDGIELSSV